MNELDKFRGPVEARDQETIEYWRNAPPEAHAKAMIELSNHAERMARQLGVGTRSAASSPAATPPLILRDILRAGQDRG